ncbi:hypothetical protein EN792_051415, partial [Mesorhizobium sp. M00.F.Ca.ET.149.01.1.1]
MARPSAIPRIFSVQPAKLGAAPHLPAGIFSPYRDGEKGLAATTALRPAALVIGEIEGGSVLRPV